MVLITSRRAPGVAAASKARRFGLVRYSSLLFAVPALLLYAFIVAFPTLRGVGYAFTDWDGVSRSANFVGAGNFIRALSEPGSLTALFVTVVIAASVTVFQNVIGLGLALGVNSQIKSRNVLRVFFFAPAVMTPVVVAYLWKYILAPDGALNNLLDVLGLSSLQQSWLGEQGWELFSVVLVIVWQFSGVSMVIYLAALQSISPDILEAASIDGAGPLRRFWSITRPLLAPATTINVMLCVIGGLKQFDQVWILTGGGPGGSTNTLSTLIYTSAFSLSEYGYGTALAVVLAVFVVIVSIAQFRAMRRGEQTNA